MGSRNKPKYPEELNDLITARAREGIGPARILEEIRSGELPGIDKPVDMRDGTFWDRWRKIRQHVDPSTIVPRGQEVETLDTLTRELIAMSKRAAKRLQQKERLPGGLGAKEINELRALGKTVADLKRAIEAPARATTPGGRGSEAARDVPRSPLKDRALAAMKREREADEAIPDAA